MSTNFVKQSRFDVFRWVYGTAAYSRRFIETEDSSSELRTKPGRWAGDGPDFDHLTLIALSLRSTERVSADEIRRQSLGGHLWVLHNFVKQSRFDVFRFWKPSSRADLFANFGDQSTR